MHNRLASLVHLIPEILLALLILTLPFSPKLGNYLLILLSIVAVLIYRVWRTPHHLPRFLYFLILCYLVRILWLIPADDFRYGLRTLETELPLAALPLIFVFVSLSQGATRRLSDTYVWMAFLMMVYSFATLFYYIQNSEYTIWNYWETHFITAQYYSMLNMLSWSYAHYSFLSLIVIYGLNLLVFRKKKHRLFIVFMCIYALLAWAFIIVAGSLAGMVIMGGCYTVYILIWIYTRWGSRPVAALAAAAMAILVTLLATIELPDRLSQLDPQRSQFFRVAYDAWLDRPLVGYGTGSQKSIIQDVDRAETLGIPRNTYSGKEANHPHNQFLTDLLQFGLIGTFPLVLFLTFSIHSSIKTRNWALLLTVLTAFAAMMVESPINSNKGLVPFVLLVCILATPSPTEHYSIDRKDVDLD